MFSANTITQPEVSPQIALGRTRAWWRAIASLPVRLKNWTDRYRGLREAHRQTNRLSERMLRDVGITRSELPTATIAPTPYDALYLTSITPRTPSSRT